MSFMHLTSMTLSLLFTIDAGISLVLPPGGKGAWIGQVVHQSDIENLERRLVSYNRVWLLMGRSRDPGGLIKATIEAQFQRRLERRVTDAEIVLYVRNHP